MRRYRFLQKEDIYEALNKVRNAFLAAKNGTEVEEIINGLLTQDEKIKIGRRVLVAEYINSGISFDEISRILKVGRNTIASVMKNLDEHPTSFTLIEQRRKKVDKEYDKNKYIAIGGSNLVLKRKEYTGYKRKDVGR